MPAELLAPALATGNAVVWTPAPTTSVCAVKLAECIVEADLPPGVFNMVTGEGPTVGDEVASNSGTRAVSIYRVHSHRPESSRPRRRQSHDP